MADIIRLIDGLLSSDDFLSDSSSGFLSESLNAALASLKDNFGVEDPYISIEEGADGYAKLIKQVMPKFSSLFSELNSMRSSFLPIELVQGIPTLTGEELTMQEIIDTESQLESFENTFFRLLGMPSTADITEDEPLYIVSSDGELIEDYIQEDYMGVLDVRQTRRKDRPRAVTNSIFDFLYSSQDPYEGLLRMGFQKIEVLQELILKLKEIKEIDVDRSLTLMQRQNNLISFLDENSGVIGLRDGGALISDIDEELTSAIRLELWARQSGTSSASGFEASLFTVFKKSIEFLEPGFNYEEDLLTVLFEKEVLGQSDPSVMGLEDPANFWKFSYLLFPPVQDGRIAKCINEPKRMVAEPFMPKTLRTVNRQALKSTLLEAIIRIRLDVVSGTILNAPNLSEGDSAPITVGTYEKPISYADIADQMGLLESLIVVRLFTTLHSFVIDIKKNREDILKIQHQTGLAPKRNIDIESDNSATPLSKVEHCESSPERCRLEAMKAMEDALMLILGDNEAPFALDLQEDTVRNSSVRSAHLMGAVLATMDVPRLWVEGELNKLNEKEVRKAVKKGDAGQSQISSKLGVAKGVGAVDVIAFLIALFTAEEKTLISLLTEEQFINLKLEYSSGFFDQMAEDRDTMATAVNDIALRAFDAYKLFLYMFEQPDGEFVFPDLDQDD